MDASIRGQVKQLSNELSSLNVLIEQYEKDATSFNMYYLFFEYCMNMSIYKEQQEKLREEERKFKISRIFSMKLVIKSIKY